MPATAPHQRRDGGTKWGGMPSADDSKSPGAAKKPPPSPDPGKTPRSRSVPSARGDHVDDERPAAAAMSRHDASLEEDAPMPSWAMAPSPSAKTPRGGRSKSQLPTGEATPRMIGSGYGSADQSCVVSGPVSHSPSFNQRSSKNASCLSTPMQVPRTIGAVVHQGVGGSAVVISRVASPALLRLEQRERHESGNSFTRPATVSVGDEEEPTSQTSPTSPLRSGHRSARSVHSSLGDGLAQRSVRGDRGHSPNSKTPRDGRTPRGGALVSRRETADLTGSDAHDDYAAEPSRKPSQPSLSLSEPTQPSISFGAAAKAASFGAKLRALSKGPRAPDPEINRFQFQQPSELGPGREGGDSKPGSKAGTPSALRRPLESTPDSSAKGSAPTTPIALRRSRSRSVSAATLIDAATAKKLQQEEQDDAAFALLDEAAAASGGESFRAGDSFRDSAAFGRSGRRARFVGVGGDGEGDATSAAPLGAEQSSIREEDDGKSGGGSDEDEDEDEDEGGGEGDGGDEGGGEGGGEAESSSAPTSMMRRGTMGAYSRDQLRSLMKKGQMAALAMTSFQTSWTLCNAAEAETLWQKPARSTRTGLEDSAAILAARTLMQRPEPVEQGWGPTKQAAPTPATATAAPASVGESAAADGAGGKSSKGEGDSSDAKKPTAPSAAAAATPAPPTALPMVVLPGCRVPRSAWLNAPENRSAEEKAILVHWLRGVPMLNEMTEPMLAAIAARAPVVRVKYGQLLHRVGERDAQCFLLLSGGVAEVVREAPDPFMKAAGIVEGKPAFKLHRASGAGHSVGYEGLAYGAARATTAVTTESTELVVVSKGLLDEEFRLHNREGLQRKLRTLQATQLFDRWKTPQLAKLAISMQGPYSRPKHALLAAQGEPADRVFLIESGEVRLRRAANLVEPLAGWRRQAELCVLNEKCLVTRLGAAGAPPQLELVWPYEVACHTAATFYVCPAETFRSFCSPSFIGWLATNEAVQHGRLDERLLGGTSLEKTLADEQRTREVVRHEEASLPAARPLPPASYRTMQRHIDAILARHDVRNAPDAAWEALTAIAQPGGGVPAPSASTAAFDPTALYRPQRARPKSASPALRGGAASVQSASQLPSAFAAMPTPHHFSVHAGFTPAEMVGAATATVTSAAALPTAAARGATKPAAPKSWSADARAAKPIAGRPGSAAGMRGSASSPAIKLARRQMVTRPPPGVRVIGPRAANEIAAARARAKKEEEPAEGVGPTNRPLVSVAYAGTKMTVTY